MSKRESVFSDEWRRCLREHYKYVVRQQDNNTKETLTPILEKFGFREEELRRLAVEATMHVDDVADDFVPDMELLDEQSVEDDKAPEVTFVTHPAECTCPSCMDTVLEAGHDDDGQPLEEEPEQEKQGTLKQKTLF